MGSKRRIFSATECVLAVHGHSRSSKVDDFGTNRKRVCDFLLVINSNFGPMLHSSLLRCGQNCFASADLQERLRRESLEREKQMEQDRMNSKLNEKKKLEVFLCFDAVVERQ